jgi:hypothetical protein
MLQRVRLTISGVVLRHIEVGASFEFSIVMSGSNRTRTTSLESWDPGQTAGT